MRFAERGSRQFLASGGPKIPPLIYLSKLLAASDRVVADKESDADAAGMIIGSWQSDFQALDAVASANVARVSAAMQNVQNSTYQAALAEAQHNLTYAESDESGGFHNHPYLMALLKDANQKALSIPLLNITEQNGDTVISWNGAGTLQAAASPAGPWHDVSEATNPMTVPLTTQTQCQFYRLRL